MSYKKGFEIGCKVVYVGESNDNFTNNKRYLIINRQIISDVSPNGKSHATKYEFISDKGYRKMSNGKYFISIDRYRNDKIDSILI